MIICCAFFLEKKAPVKAAFNLLSDRRATGPQPICYCSAVSIALQGGVFPDLFFFHIQLPSSDRPI